jgi:hypothetical protein
MSRSRSLPLLDEHSAMLLAGQTTVWPVVRQYARGLAQSDHAVLGRILGTEPQSGFDVAEEVKGERVVLTGRHRFARYRLVFELDAQQQRVRHSCARSNARWFEPDAARICR